MGCPVPKIVAKGQGSALMRDPLAAAVIFRTLRKAVSVPFTIKIRGGWDDHTINAVEIARLARERGRGRGHRAPAHALAAVHRPRAVGRDRRGGGRGAAARHRQRRRPQRRGRARDDRGHRLRGGHDRPRRAGRPVDLPRRAAGPRGARGDHPPPRRAHRGAPARAPGAGAAQEAPGVVLGRAARLGRAAPAPLRGDDAGRGSGAVLGICGRREPSAGSRTFRSATASGARARR